MIELLKWLWGLITGKGKTMSVNEAEAHKAQKKLNDVIEFVTAARLEACKTGQCEARDKLGKALGHLHIANAEAGSIRMNDSGGNMIQPRSGGK